VAGPVLSERGGVLVMVAVWLPVLLVFLMFVVEVGNWFEHKRHLQMQADSGAFAGGDLFNACFTDNATGSAAIDSEARRYAGDPSWAGALGAAVYNSQIGGSNRGAVTVRINRKTFQVGGPPADDTIESGACTAKMVDVKVTEANLPWFFRLRVVPAINAHARVEMRQKDTAAGSLPVGVPDTNPLSAAAIFVNQTTGATIASEALTKIGTTTMNGASLTQWSGSASPVSVPIDGVAVIIALSGLAPWSPSGTLTEICGQTLVECYDGGGGGPWTGLNFIHAYRATGGSPSATNPVVRDVVLYNQSCGDGSGPYFLLRARCTIGLKAKIDFGTGANNPTKPPNQGGVNAEVKIDRSNTACPNSGQNPKGCPLTYVSSSSDPNFGYWVTTDTGGFATIAGSTAGASNAIDLNWGTGSGSSKASGTLFGVHRVYSAGENSEPIEYVSVSETGPGANSLTVDSHNLSVTIGVKQSLQANASSPTAGAVALKVTGSGSRGQAVDCDPTPGTNLAYELGHGCTPSYTINKGTPCKSQQYYSTLPQTASWDCTLVQTGGSVGQVHDGMLDRTQGFGVTTCVNPINWTDVNGDGKVTVPEDISPGDPRLVPVFVVPFASFNGSGNDVIPITNFATFYVTGFSKQGGGQGDPCPGASPVPNKTGGYIVGRFIKYVDSINTGGGGSACDFNAFGTCVAVLTQ
jgi:Flp pilus assembly protein TadG